MSQDADHLIVGMESGSAVSPGQLTFFDDLNAVRMFLWNSLLEPKDYNFQRQRANFERDTFLIQSLSQSLVPKTGYHVEIDHSMLVELYALDYLTAQAVAGDLLLLFGAGNSLDGSIDPSRRGGGLVLPYWDMSQPTPQIRTDEWWSENSNFPPGSVPLMGCRVVQDTVVINAEQEDSEILDQQDWTVSMTFRMLATRVLYDYTLERPVTEVKLTGVLSG